MKLFNNPKIQVWLDRLSEIYNRDFIFTPNKNISRANTDNITVEFGVDGALDTGIDIENKTRQINHPEKLKLKLISDIEVNTYSQILQIDTLQLWTVKEALFKANKTSNTHTLIKEYKIISPYRALFQEHVFEHMSIHTEINNSQYVISFAIKII